MKKMLCALLLCLMLLPLAGCGEKPNSMQLDVYRGADAQLKLLHLNISSTDKKERIEAFAKAIRNAEPIEKPMSLFAYYPDYTIEITPWEGGKLTVVVDVNGDWVDFYYPGPNPESSDTIYRSKMSAKEFNLLINTQ